MTYWGWTLQIRAIVPRIQNLVEMCKEVGIPIFYLKTFREPSGINLITKFHRIYYQNPENRRQQRFQSERVRGTWIAQTIEELKSPSADQVVVIKRRASAFQDIETRLS